MIRMIGILVMLMLSGCTLLVGQSDNIFVDEDGGDTDVVDTSGDADGDSDSDADGDVDTDGDVDSDGDSDSDADGDVDSDSDADSDSDTDTSNCYIGDYTINYSSEVDAIASYSCITGDLTIEYAHFTDLELHNLVWVGGSLSIGSTWFTSMEGLSSLTIVGGSLLIGNNNGNIDHEGLQTLEGLNNLVSVGPYLYIMTNTHLPQCDVCNLLDQLGDYPGVFYSVTNQDDTCNDECSE